MIKRILKVLSWMDAPVRPHVAVGGQARAGEAGEGVPALVLVDVEVP